MAAAGCGCTIARCPAIQSKMGQRGGVARLGLRAHHTLPKMLLRDVRNTSFDVLERALPPEGKERAAIASGRILSLAHAGYEIGFWGACVTGRVRARWLHPMVKLVDLLYSTSHRVFLNSTSNT